MGLTDSRICSMGEDINDENNIKEYYNSHNKLEKLKLEEMNENEVNSVAKNDDQQILTLTNTNDDNLNLNSSTLTYLHMLRKMHQNDIVQEMTLELNKNIADDTDVSEAASNENKPAQLTRRDRTTEYSKDIPRLTFKSEPQVAYVNTNRSNGIIEIPDGEEEMGVSDLESNRSYNDNVCGYVEVYLIGVQGLPLNKDARIYAVFQIENADEEKELKSRPVELTTPYPQWGKRLGRLRIEDHTRQALQVNIYRKRKLRSDKLLYFADIGLETLHDGATGEVVSELEQVDSEELVGEFHVKATFYADKD